MVPAPVAKMKCPACERRATSNRLTMHSPRELAVCQAMKEGVTVEEIQKRWQREMRETESKTEMIVEAITFRDGPYATITIRYDTGAFVYMATSESEELPVPPIGLKVPNTHGFMHKRTFVDRLEWKRRMEKLNAMIRPYMKPLSVVRTLGLTTEDE